MRSLYLLCLVEDASVGSFFVVEVDGKPGEYCALYVARLPTGERTVKKLLITFDGTEFRASGDRMGHSKLSSVIVSHRKSLVRPLLTADDAAVAVAHTIRLARSLKVSQPLERTRDLSPGSTKSGSPHRIMPKKELWVLGTGTTLGDGRADLHLVSAVTRIGLATVSSCAAGATVAAAVCTKERRVFVWGSGPMTQPVPRVAPHLVDVKAVACGDGHVLALTASGQVYSWLEGCVESVCLFYIRVYCVRLVMFMGSKLLTDMLLLCLQLKRSIRHESTRRRTDTGAYPFVNKRN